MENGETILTIFKNRYRFDSISLAKKLTLEIAIFKSWHLQEGQIVKSNYVIVDPVKNDLRETFSENSSDPQYSNSITLIVCAIRFFDKIRRGNKPSILATIIA